MGFAREIPSNCLSSRASVVSLSRGELYNLVKFMVHCERKLVGTDGHYSGEARGLNLSSLVYNRAEINLHPRVKFKENRLGYSRSRFAYLLLLGLNPLQHRMSTVSSGTYDPASTL